MHAFQDLLRDLGSMYAEERATNARLRSELVAVRGWMNEGHDGDGTKLALGPRTMPVSPPLSARGALASTPRSMAAGKSLPFGLLDHNSIDSAPLAKSKTDAAARFVMTPPPRNQSAAEDISEDDPEAGSRGDRPSPLRNTELDETHQPIRPSGRSSAAFATARTAEFVGSMIKKQFRELSGREDQDIVDSQGRLAIVRKATSDITDSQAVAAIERSESLREPTKKDAHLTARLHAMSKRGYSGGTGASCSLVRSPWFSWATGILIVLNAIYIGLQTDLYVKAQFDRLDGQPHEDKKALWLVGDATFALVFLIEIVLRLGSERFAFFVGTERWWNIFDLIIVLTAIFELATEFVGDSSSFGVRVLRTLRIVRILRVMRVGGRNHLVQHIKTMLYQLMASWTSFVSAIILLCVVLFIFAMVFMQGLLDYLRDVQVGNSSTTTVSDMKENFGTLPRSLWTLFAAVTGGHDWVNISPSITEVGGVYTFALLLYIAFVLLALLNILNGIFVNVAFQCSAMNRELAIDAVMKKREVMVKEMVQLFLEMDQDESGTLTWDEFQDHLRDEKIKAYFMALDLDMTSVRRIFHLLDSHERGRVTLHEFVEGCIRLRGAAKMVDITMLNEQVKSLTTVLHRIERVMDGPDRRQDHLQLHHELPASAPENEELG